MQHARLRALVGIGFGIALLTSPRITRGAPASGDEECKLLFKATSDAEPAEFTIGWDGAVVRSTNAKRISRTVALFADNAARGIMPSAEALGTSEITIELRLVNSLSAGSAAAPQFIRRCSVTYAARDVLGKAFALPTDWAPEQKAGIWRLVVFIDRDLLDPLHLPNPKLRTGDYWARIEKEVPANEVRFIRSHLAALGPKESRKLIEAARADLHKLIERMRAFSPSSAEGLAALEGELIAFADAQGPDATTKWNELVRDKAYSPAICDLARQYDLYKASVSRVQLLYGSFDLPRTDAARTLELPATGATREKVVLGDDVLTTWATFVPSDVEDVRFQWVKGAKLDAGIASVLGAFISALVPSTKIFAADGQITLFDLTTGSACSGEVEYPLAPLAPLRSFASTTGALALRAFDKGTNYTVYACNGTCVLAGARTTTIAQASARTTSGWGLALFGSLAYDLRWHGLHAPKFTQYQWVPTSTSSGQQLFELDEIAQPKRSISSALFLALRFPECAPDDTHRLCALQRALHPSVGAGPTILLGDGSGKLAQWTVNLFVAPGRVMSENKLYLTAGAGFRLFDRPVVGKTGDVIQAASAPTITATTTHAEWVMTVGFGVDLSVIGDAASSVFGAKAPADPSTRTGGTP